MNISTVYSIANRLSATQKELWKKNLYATMEPLSSEVTSLCLPDMMAALAMCGNKSGFYGQEKIVLYGAGLKAKHNIIKVAKYLHIAAVWDTYAEGESFEGHHLSKPFVRDFPKDILIIICVAKRAMQEEIADMLQQHGYSNIMTIQQYLMWQNVIPMVQELAAKATPETFEKIAELEKEYEIIHDDSPQVLYDVLPTRLKHHESCVRWNASAELTEEICNGLFDKLLLNEEQQKQIRKYVQTFAQSIVLQKQDEFSFYIGLELMLRNVLAGRVKTKYRPIRMQGDDIYDQCAVFESCCVIYEAFFKHNLQLILSTLQEQLSFDFGLMTRILNCHYLLVAKRLEDALEAGRNLMVDAPNDFLASEVYCDAVYACRKEGRGDVSQTESVPDYDLRERFCWSGFSFAWCGGFIGKEQKAYLQPCFRPIQCAAKPDGDAWTSWEWQDFRKSLLDGSFRYCQKNQCANLASGWLPYKDKCQDQKLQKIFQGNYSEVPELTELHFSYDRHCNLCCPSCRTEFATNKAEDNRKMDELYDNNLKPLLKQAHHLCLSGCGEALLSRHGRRILMGLVPEEYPNLEIELRTNMTVLNEKNWLSLGEGRRTIKHIAASIDAARKETFEDLRYPAKWDIVLDNLKFVQRLRQQDEIEMFEFHVVVQEKNVEELMDIIRLAQSLDVDTVTFSKMLNWRDIPAEEYHQMNPFYVDNPTHVRFIEVLREIRDLQEQMESDSWEKSGRKRMYINMHGLKDPSPRYDEIRYGRFRIR